MYLLQVSFAVSAFAAFLSRAFRIIATHQTSAAATKLQIYVCFCRFPCFSILHTSAAAAFAFSAFASFRAAVPLHNVPPFPLSPCVVFHAPPYSERNAVPPLVFHIFQYYKERRKKYRSKVLEKSRFLIVPFYLLCSRRRFLHALLFY